MRDTNLLINGLSKDLESLKMTTSSGHSSNPQRTHKRYKTAKVRRSGSKEPPLDSGHPLMKDFLSDFTGSENKRQMEAVVAEAKRVINECDQQMHRNSSAEEIVIHSTVIAKLSTPPAHAIKSPHDPRVQMLKVEVKDMHPKSLMMIEDNLTPALYDESSSRAYGDDASDQLVAERQLDTRHADQSYDGEQESGQTPGSFMHPGSESDTTGKH